MVGMRKSVTITSNKAESILRLASSRLLTVSTLYPCLRKSISSTWQRERSSSQTRMLATRASYLHSGTRVGACLGRIAGGDRNFLLGLRESLLQIDDEVSTRAWLRLHRYLGVMCLQDLIHDRQTQSGATAEAGMEGLENLLHLRLRNAGAGVGEADLPVVPLLLQ